MIEDEIINVNKKITRLRYEYEKYNQQEVKNMLDLLQYHLFLAHTYFNKSEFSYDELIKKLKEKMSEETGEVK